MPDLLESGELQISREKASEYRAAADWVHETCAMARDLLPIDWVGKVPHYHAVT